MGTRSFVGQLHEDNSFIATYVHWDGYPTAKIENYRTLLARFDGSIEHLLGVLRGGGSWSSINHHQPATAGEFDRQECVVEGVGIRHGEGQGASEVITGRLGEVFDGWGTEWGYLFTSTNPAEAELVVLSIGWNGKDDTNTEVWRAPVRELHKLSEVDIERIECPDFSDCCHVEGYHEGREVRRANA